LTWSIMVVRGAGAGGGAAGAVEAARPERRGAAADLACAAHFGHRDHSDRSIVISEIGGS